MNSENIFGKRIKELRIAKKLTQLQLGEIVGLSKQSINDIEKGRRETSIAKMILLAKALKTSLDYLVGESDDPTRHEEISKMEKFFSDKNNIQVINRLFSLCKEKNIPIEELNNVIILKAHSYDSMISYDFPSLCSLADYFNVSIDYLVGRTDNPEVNK